MTRPLAALVIRPNEPLLTVWLGFAKFTWLSALKNSPRNCSFHASRSAKSLSAAKSELAEAGPLIRRAAGVAVEAGGQETRLNESAGIEELRDERVAIGMVERDVRSRDAGGQLRVLRSSGAVQRYIAALNKGQRSAALQCGDSG